MNNLTEMLKGVLEGCILEIISKKAMYGYEITKRLNTSGFEDVVEGTVYTILIRLEKNNLVSIEKKLSDMGPNRKFYSLNESGKKELKAFWGRWDFISKNIYNLKEEIS